MRRVASAILRHGGYSVVEAALPHAALTMVRDQQAHFDLMLTDVVMPEMSGRQLARVVADTSAPVESALHVGLRRRCDRGERRRSNRVSRSLPSRLRRKRFFEAVRATQDCRSAASSRPTSRRRCGSARRRWIDRLHRGRVDDFQVLEPQSRGCRDRARHAAVRIAATSRSPSSSSRRASQQRAIQRDRLSSAARRSGDGCASSSQVRQPRARWAPPQWRLGHSSRRPFALMIASCCASFSPKYARSGCTI